MSNSQSKPSAFGSITRRQCLQAVGGTAVAGAAIYAFAQRPPNLSDTPAAFDGRPLFDDVAAFDDLGVHRTASRVDHATSRWLSEHLRSSGFEITTQSFKLRQFFPALSALDIPSGRIVVHPQWPVPETLDIEDILAPDRIALVEFCYNPRARIDLPEYRSVLVEAKARGARAAIAITEGPTDDIIVMNAPEKDWELPLPVVLAAPRDLPRIIKASNSAARVRLRVGGHFEPSATAFNTIGHIDRGTPWIVVSTPQSGWTNAAGERGPGIAIWRALATELGRAAQSSILLVSTSGHELGHLGAKAALPLIASKLGGRELRLWLHLGANIATRDYSEDIEGPGLLDAPYQERYLVASPSLLAPLTWSFWGEPGLTPLPAMSDSIAGEIGTVIDYGFAPAAGFFGKALFHHTFGDRSSQATSPKILEAVAERLLRFVRFIDLG